MPEISRFYGIIIKMYFDDHLPPHFHAEYGEHEVLLNIDALGVIAGGLPPRAMGMVLEWARLHQDELKGHGIEQRIFSRQERSILCRDLGDSLTRADSVSGLIGPEGLGFSSLHARPGS